MRTAVTNYVQVHTNYVQVKACHKLCVGAHLHYLFSCFWQHFYLKVHCFICRNLTLSLFKKDVFIRNGYFSLIRSISTVSIFYLKLFLQTEGSQNAFSFNQIESQVSSMYFSMILYFEKSLIILAVNKVYFFYFI